MAGNKAESPSGWLPRPLPSPLQRGQEMEKVEERLQDFLPCRAVPCHQQWCPTGPPGRVCAAFPHPPPHRLLPSSATARQLLSPVRQPVLTVTPHCDFVAKTYIFSSPAARRGNPSGPGAARLLGSFQVYNKASSGWAHRGAQPGGGERGIPHTGGSCLPGPCFQASRGEVLPRTRGPPQDPSSRVAQPLGHEQGLFDFHLQP